MASPDAAGAWLFVFCSAAKDDNDNAETTDASQSADSAAVEERT